MQPQISGKTDIYRNTKSVLCQFRWDIRSKVEISFSVTWSFSPAAWILRTRLPNVQENTFILSAPWNVHLPNRHLISLAVWNPDINASHPSEAAGSSRQSHIVIQVAFQVHCFSPLRFHSFTDLTSKATLLTFKRIFTFSADKESPQNLHFLCSVLFLSVCLCLSGSLLHGSVLLLSSYLLQLLQENPEVFWGSSSSITWVCPRGNNQEFTPTRWSLTKAPLKVEVEWLWIQRSRRLSHPALVCFVFKWVKSCSYRHYFCFSFL